MIRWLKDVLNYRTIPYSWPEKREKLEFISRTRKRTTLMMSDNEAYNLMVCAEAHRHIEGVFVEVGVADGGSAELLAHVKGERKLYLFDDFNGIFDANENDCVKNGDYKPSKNSIVSKLGGKWGVFVIPGVFPESGEIIDEKIAFAHLDVDTYLSTKSSLLFLCSHLSKGGSILVHDYQYYPEVKRAVNEAGEITPLVIIPMYETQALIKVVK